MNDAHRIGRRRAWQFAVVPLQRVGDELEVLSTAAHAARAMRFIERVLGLRPRVRLVSESTLIEALQQFQSGIGLSWISSDLHKELTDTM